MVSGISASAEMCLMVASGSSAFVSEFSERITPSFFIVHAQERLMSMEQKWLWNHVVLRSQQEMAVSCGTLFAQPTRADPSHTRLDMNYDESSIFQGKAPMAEDNLRILFTFVFHRAGNICQMGKYLMQWVRNASVLLVMLWCWWGATTIAHGRCEGMVIAFSMYVFESA